jgi:glutaminyl-tRNA synthetase
MRRRGYTAEILNTFCNDVGASRATNLVEMSKLQQTARLLLSTTSRRAMAALDPILVTITNYAEESSNEMTFEVQNSPTDASLGSHTVTLTEQIYIDASDFRLEDSKTYYGLAPNKAVGLKYHGGNLVCDEVLQKDDKVVELKCHLDSSEGRPKPKSFVTWVSSDGIPCEVRVYNHLFTVPEPTDQWEEELNPESEVVFPKAIVDPSVREVVDAKNVDKWNSNTALQFERIGYFVVDQDTTYDSETNTGNLVFNKTVSLKEEVFKKKLTPEEEAAIENRRAQAQKDLEAKEKRMQIDPINLFREADEYKGKYSKFDEETGIPTHLADGTELAKSARKKLDKEKTKHMKVQAKWKKQQQK